MVDEGIQFSQIPAEIDMHKDAWRVARIMTIPLCYLYIWVVYGIGWALAVLSQPVLNYAIKKQPQLSSIIHFVALLIIQKNRYIVDEKSVVVLCLHFIFVEVIFPVLVSSNEVEEQDRQYYQQ
jgi:hypothetical protein